MFAPYRSGPDSIAAGAHSIVVLQINVGAHEIIKISFDQKIMKYYKKLWRVVVTRSGAASQQVHGPGYVHAGVHTVDG